MPRRISPSRGRRRRISSRVRRRCTRPRARRRPRWARRRVEARRRAHVPHHPEHGPAVGPAHGVHRARQRFRDRRPHGAVAPAAGLAAEQRQLGHRIARPGRRVAVGPLECRYRRSVGLVERRLERPELHDDAALSALGAQRVAVPAVDDGVPVLVGLRRARAHNPEGLRRQVGHGEGVLHEQLALRLPFEVMGLAGPGHAFAQQPLVVGPDVVDAGHGNEHVAPDGAHGVLHRALLVARGGIAEGEPEAVVGREPLEGVGRAHSLADAPADAGGVVEHEPRRHAAAELEHRLEALAHALGRLAPEALGQRHVREGERHHEVVNLADDPEHSEVADAEIHLRIAWRPFEVEELALRVFDLRLPLLHVFLDRRVPAAVAAFRHEPVEDPGRSMALLGAPLPVFRGPRVDGRFVGVELRWPGLPRLDGLGREVVHVPVLAHRGLGHALLPGDLGDAVAVGAPPPD